MKNYNPNGKSQFQFSTETLAKIDRKQLNFVSILDLAVFDYLIINGTSFFIAANFSAFLFAKI